MVYDAPLPWVRVYNILYFVGLRLVPNFLHFLKNGAFESHHGKDAVCRSSAILWGASTRRRANPLLF